ncbi:MAG: hypothetical protein WDA68_11770 [Phycisphaerae bacterium]|jgi:hypothetical protein|nr:hypothetical protein [Candidatus Paceibacterota bacterium]
METNKKFEIIEKGEVINDLSLDMITGGLNNSEAGACDYCNTCDNSGGNNTKSIEEPQSIGMD